MKSSFLSLGFMISRWQFRKMVFEQAGLSFSTLIKFGNDFFSFAHFKR